MNIVEEALNLIQKNEDFQKVIDALFKEEETEEEKIKKHVTKVLSIKSPEYEYKISWK